MEAVPEDRFARARAAARAEGFELPHFFDTDPVPIPGEPCKACGFDSLVSFSSIEVTDDGVEVLPANVYCTRPSCPRNQGAEGDADAPRDR